MAKAGKSASRKGKSKDAAVPAKAVASRSASALPAKQSSERKANRPDKRIVALVYDFDGTLSPKPMQEYGFLPEIGVSPAEFWAETTQLAREQKADPLITYMHLMYRKAKERNIRIDRKDLVAQGAKVELFPGVMRWFDAIGDYVSARTAGTAPADEPVDEPANDIELRHYLVSSGLAEVIEGTPIFHRFHNVFASEYWFDAYETPFPKRVITDTGKTQFLFRINKGIEDYSESINSHMPEANRPVPFSNMIYFGDGETDVPSMALLKKNGGAAIAVHPPGGDAHKCEELFRAGRCDFYAAADYSTGSDLFRRTCLLIDRIIADINVRTEMGALDRAI